MTFTACFTRETTCTAVLHSVWENEPVGIFLKIISVCSLTEGKGEWMYSGDDSSVIRSLRWADCRTAPGVLSGVKSDTMMSPTPARWPWRKPGMGVGEDFCDSSSFQVDDEIVLFREVEGVERRLASSESLGWLSSCWLSLSCISVVWLKFKRAGSCWSWPWGPGPQATRQTPRCFTLKGASELEP